MTLNEFSDWLSIGSAVVAIYTAIGVTTIRRRMVSRAMLPALNLAIRLNISRMQEHLSSEPQDRKSFDAELHKCKVNVSAVKKVIAKEYKPKASETIRAIDVYLSGGYFGFKKKDNSIDRAWEIWGGLQGLSRQIELVLDERQVGGDV